MDMRADTLSGRFGGQWAFLSNLPHHGNPRSLPPSSYLPRSEHSITSPQPVVSPLYHLDASRSSLYRTYPAASIGGYTSATSPSQPILIRVDASAISHPNPRGPGRKPDMSRDELPPISDFSIQGILAAIQEEIEPDVNAISEILGRSRLALADQHESHMPPQGEIRAGLRPLQGIAEVSSSNERLAADNVLILHDEASLIDGSRAGSAAYGLLERLQAVPRARRQRSDPPVPTRSSIMPQRISSSPAVLPEASFTQDFGPPDPAPRSSRAPRYLLQNFSNPTADPAVHSRTTNAVVSETYLSAGANGTTVSNPPVVSEAGRNYPLYSYDESDLFETMPIPLSPPRSRGLRSRLPNLRRITHAYGWKWWQWRPEQAMAPHSSSQGAEERLRDILDRHHELGSEEQNLEPGEDENMYD